MEIEDLQSRTDLADAYSRETLDAFRSCWTSLLVRLHSAVYWRNRPQWGLPWRTVPDSFLLFPTSGTLRVVTKQEDVVIHPGGCLVLAPGIPHRLESGSQESPLCQISLHLDLIVLGDHEEPLARLGSPVVLEDDFIEVSLPFLQLVCAISLSHPHAAELAATAWVRQFYFRMVRSDASGGTRPFTRGSVDPRIRVALDRIRKEYSKPLTIADLARSSGLSEVHFRKRFRESVGDSPRSFLIDWRLRQAAVRLRSTGETISTIAAECGFASESHFHQSFRRRFGTSPHRWRQAMRESL